MKKNLNTGKSSTSKKDFTTEEICRIISTCKDAGVVDFSHQGLSFSFLPHRNEEVAQPGQASNLAHASVSEQHTSQHPNLDLMDEEAMREAEEAQLLISDPYAFEKLQIQRDVERTRGLNEKT